jgi:hypothetical protein
MSACSTPGCVKFAAFAVVALASAIPITRASAFDDSKFPAWHGQWGRVGDARWDTTKPRLAQEAPLTPEYQAFLQASIAEQRAGGHGNDLMYKCYPPGMPRMMLAYNPIEFVFTPNITYVLLEHMTQHRHVYTDGRPWPETLKPTFVGYSIGEWVDQDGDGRYDALLIETRGMRGPRAFDSSGLPLHSDNATVVKERIYLDATDPNLLHNEITTFDHALTRPWTVTRNYRREQKPVWIEHICAEDNRHVEIGTENYFINFDGSLMPTRKDQPAPKMKGFDQAKR